MSPGFFSGLLKLPRSPGFFFGLLKLPRSQSLQTEETTPRQDKLKESSCMVSRCFNVPKPKQEIQKACSVWNEIIGCKEISVAKSAESDFFKATT